MRNRFKIRPDAAANSSRAKKVAAATGPSHTNRSFARAVQAKLTVGPVGDPLEREADAVAKDVMGNLSAGGAEPATPQRQEEEELMQGSFEAQRQEEEEELQMQPEEEELMQGSFEAQRQEEEEELQMQPEEEELMQGSFEAQRQEQGQEEEEEIQPRRADVVQGSFEVQRQEDEELLQGSFEAQRQEEEELLQGSFEAQRQEEEEEELQMAAQVGAEGGALDSDVESQVRSAQGGGSPLDGALRRDMEGSFGADFSGVRVHTNDAADGLSQSIQAKAFTTGNDVFFRKGNYDPGSDSGRELIAHELTHVVQQGAAKSVNRRISRR